MGRLVLNPWDFLRQIIRSGLRETSSIGSIRLGLAAEEGQSDGYRIRIRIQILPTFELTNDRGSKVSPVE